MEIEIKMVIKYEKFKYPQKITKTIMLIIININPEMKNLKSLNSKLSNFLYKKILYEKKLNVSEMIVDNKTIIL